MSRKRSRVEASSEVELRKLEMALQNSLASQVTWFCVDSGGI